MVDRPAPDWMRTLVESTGGCVEDERFVVSPGCMIIASTVVSKECELLLAELNIRADQPDYRRLAELNARLTYLSFKETEYEANADRFLDRLAREHQHLSVFAGTSVTFLLAGISVETSMELLAHHEARVARVTTSNTKAMDRPLFRLQGDRITRDRQKEAILALLAVRHPLVANSEREFYNINNPGSKVTAITFTMTLKDYHTLFIGRLPLAGNETEVREVCGLMCNRLAAAYPLVIRPRESYVGMNNGAKYGS
jgi:hypothetical protein